MLHNLGEDALDVVVVCVIIQIDLEDCSILWSLFFGHWFHCRRFVARPT